MSNLEFCRLVHRGDNIAKNGNLLELTRGEPRSTQFHADLQKLLGTIRQRTYHRLNPGEIGGNHYHKKKKEVITSLFGELEIDLFDIEDQSIGKLIIPQGTSAYLAPGVLHKITPISPSVFQEYSNLAFDPSNPRNDCYFLQNS